MSVDARFKCSGSASCRVRRLARVGVVERRDALSTRATLTHSRRLASEPFRFVYVCVYICYSPIESARVRKEDYVVVAQSFGFVCLVAVGRRIVCSFVRRHRLQALRKSLTICLLEIIYNYAVIKVYHLSELQFVFVNYNGNDVLFNYL